MQVNRNFNPVYYFDINQGSEEWFSIKAKKISATSVKYCFSGIATASYKDLVARLVFERLTNDIYIEDKKYVNNDMLRGIELEPIAVECFESEMYFKCKEVGWVEKDEWLGCSPDRLISDNGLLEVKCPKFKTQLQLLKTKKIQKDYLTQMQTQLFVTNRDFCYFISYHENLPPFIQKIERDENRILEIDKAVKDMIQVVKKELKFIKHEM